METEFACSLSDGHAGLQGLMDGAEAFLARAGVPDRTMAQIMVALDEIVSNIFTHGAKGRMPAVEVRLRASAGLVRGEVVDNGAAFDPLAAPEPDTALPAERRTIGGLGIHIIRKTMDDIRYDRDHGRNRLRFHKRFPVRESG